MSSLAQLFETGEQSSQKGHFRNLVLLARIDGDLTESENKFLNKIAQQIGLTDEQITEIKKNPTDFPPIPPMDREERYSRLINLIQVVLDDQIIDKNEAAALKSLALSLGFKEERITELIPVIASHVKNGKSKDEILDNLLTK